MALFQRSITNSMALVPGLTVSTTGGTAGLSAYTVNGQRNTGTAMLTGTLPAEYGHSASGVISTVKKSAANELHGMAADYGRTRRMTHRQFFNSFTTAQPQPGNPNGVPAWFMQPDANVGGPIVIPKRDFPQRFRISKRIRFRK